MTVSLGTLTFDDTHTSVKESIEEVGGCDARVVELAGLIVGESSKAAIEERLDAIAAAASETEGLVSLSLRPGRVLHVRRQAFAREISKDALVGSFLMKLEAPDPAEYSEALHSVDWELGASGATKAVVSDGNRFALPVITMTASGAVVSPAFSDGARTIAYEGTVADGCVLVFDGPEGRLTLDGEDVTPYASGLFPRLEPGTTTLAYSDAPASSHAAGAAVAFRDRWW